MKKNLLISTLVLTLLICGGCKQKVKLKDGKEVIASIKGKDITAEELFEDLKKSYGSTAVVNMVDEYIVKKEIPDSKEANEYAKAQIEAMKKQYEEAGYSWEDVLSQYGYSDESDLIKEYENNYKRNLVAKKYIKKDITDDEINEYYDKEIYGNYTVKHILITPDVKDNASDGEKEKAKDKALKTAKEVIEKLDNGEKWSSLVNKYSDDTGSKENDGLIENFTKGDMVDEFFEASVKLKDGKYTKEPVESTYGYHIILKVSNTKKPSLKKAKSKILNEIAENKLNNEENLLEKTWVNIRKSYKFNINDSTIKNGYNKTISE